MTQPTARAEFEALCDEFEIAHTIAARLELSQAIAELALNHRAVIAAALPTDPAPATLPDDWRPRPDADGD